jgi:phosphomannomutase
VPEKMRVGNPFYKEKLLKRGGILAGELSGHIMFAKNYSIDDPVFAMLRLLEILKKEKKPLSQLLDEFGPFYKSEEINLMVEEPDKVLDKIEETFSDLKLEKIDGVSVYGDEFWFNVRKSNTEPLVRLNVEADNQKILEREKEEIREIIKNLSKE